VKLARLSLSGCLFATALTVLFSTYQGFAADVPAPDISARATYRWTENISRAAARADFRDTGEYELSATAGFKRQLTPRVFANLDFTLTGTTSPEYELLNRVEFGPRFTLKRKFGLGPYAPALSAEAGVTGRYAALHAQDGIGARGGVTLAKRFTPWLASSVSGEWAGHVAEHSAFSVAHWSADARLIIDPHPRLRFTTGVSRLEGTVTVSASRNRFVNGALAGKLGPAVANYFARIPVADTNIFSPAWVSYRVEGYVDSWWFDLSPALTDRTSLSLRYERNHAESIVHTQYSQDILSVSINHAF
jgi:hypothetical protein